MVTAVKTSEGFRWVQTDVVAELAAAPWVLCRAEVEMPVMALWMAELQESDRLNQQVLLETDNDSF